MLKLKALLTSLTILLVLCAPALAQSAPAADQYATGVGAKGCPGGAETAQGGDLAAASAGAGACASAENAGQGTDAVNDALTGTASSASPSAAAALAPDEPRAASASAPAEGSASGDDASTDEDEGDDEVPASITELPETGGAPPAALGVGVALVASGLAARRVVGR